MVGCSLRQNPGDAMPKLARPATCTPHHAWCACPVSPTSDQAMRASFREGADTGPALVIIALPFQPATPCASVRMPGAAASHSFFFSTAFGTAGGCKRGVCLSRASRYVCARLP